MAQWAMAVFGIAATVLSGIAVYLLKHTLQATRDAADYARQAVSHGESAAQASWQAVSEAQSSTSAARRATREARQMGEKQLRAYMSLRPDGVGFDEGRTKRLVIRVAQKNNGQTPARNVRLFQSVEWLPHPLPEDHEIPELDPFPGVNVVHPESSFSVGIFVDLFTADFVKAVEDETTSRPYVFLRLTYTDVFGAEHYTTGCWWYSTKILRDVGRAFESDAPPDDLLHVPFEYTDQHNDAT